MMSPGHCVTPLPPEQSLKEQSVAFVQSTRQGEPPEQSGVQLEALLQSMSHRAPPEQFGTHSLTLSQSM